MTQTVIVDATTLFQKRKAAILLQKRMLPKNRKYRTYEDEIEVQRAVKAVDVEKHKLIMEIKNAQ